MRIALETAAHPIEACLPHHGLSYRFVRRLRRREINCNVGYRWNVTMLFQKIGKNLFEGRLLQVSFTYLIRAIDKFLGNIARFFYAKLVRVNSKQIFFISFQGDFTCNPKYIANRLLQENADCKMVFSARRHSLNTPGAFPEGAKLVKQYSADYYKELAKSHIIIANSVEFFKKQTPLKKSQILIETWHGSLGIKRFDASVNSGRTWVEAATRCGRRCDYIISNSAFEDMVYQTSFWPNTPIWRFGHPRNDILFGDHSLLREQVYRTILDYEANQAGMAEPLEQPPDVHYLLYGPTFRDNHKLDHYLQDFTGLREALAERFGGTWKILVRLHPTVRKMAGKYLKAHSDVIDVTVYPDIQELMMVSDAAITDYSSWIYDFVLTGRPGFLYAPDIHDYEGERGFYYPLSSTPFPLAATDIELSRNIRSFDEAAYRDRVEKFLKDKGCMEDGHASERVVEQLKQLL